MLLRVSVSLRLPAHLLKSFQKQEELADQEQQQGMGIDANFIEWKLSFTFYWASPLTPPPPQPPPTTTAAAIQQQQQQHNNDIATAVHHTNADEQLKCNTIAQANYQQTPQQQNQTQQQQQDAQQQLLQFSSTNTIMDGSAATANSAILESVASGTNSNSSRFAAYNNNLFCYGGANPNAAAADEIDAAAVNELSLRLQAELRAAKSQHLACTEVSLPWDLMPRIAVEIIKTSEREPCGVRGCTIFIEFEDEPNNTRRIASFKMDPNTVSTFELYLTLKHDKSGWTSLLPQFLKNLTRSSTILISPNFTLTKNKLYFCE